VDVSKIHIFCSNPKGKLIFPTAYATPLLLPSGQQLVLFTVPLIIPE
jgi:hypothetical protein